MSAKGLISGALHSRPFQASVAAALAVMLLALAYLGARGKVPTQNFPVEKLSIALPALPQHALLQIAAAKGYLTAEGLDVTFVPASHGVMALSLLAQGKADLAVAAEVPLVISVMKGDPLAIVATMLRVSNVHAVVARRDRGNGAPRDMPGKIIGATFGTSGEYFLWAYLIRHRLAPDSVRLVDLLPGEIAPALAKSTIDAATSWYPHVRDAQDALGENALSLTAADVYTQSVVVIGRSEFLKGHANAMERLVRTMLAAEQFMRSHPEETLKLVAEWLKVDVEALRPVWKDLSFRVELQQSELITLEDEARWAMARGYAPKGPIPNFLPGLYLDALLAVRPERVTVLH